METQNQPIADTTTITGSRKNLKFLVVWTLLGKRPSFNVGRHMKKGRDGPLFEVWLLADETSDEAGNSERPLI